MATGVSVSGSAAAGPVPGQPGGGAVRPVRERVAGAFRARYGRTPPLVVRAPGRVNLIGEHTDYNDGFVLPMAIDRAVWIAFEPRADRTVAVHSLDMGEAAVASLDALRRDERGWFAYVQGVAWALAEGAGHRLAGWQGVVAGDVPIGAGLSSSAALEMATARAFAAASGLDWDPIAMARVGQRAENGWVGVQCGIMDQLAAAAGVAGHALLIDCRSLALQAVPLPPGTAVLVLDTGTRRGLAYSAYNERRAQCHAAARYFGVPALRDVSLERFRERAGGLAPDIARRARHVIGENLRTVRAAEAMRRGDAAGLGAAMNASHLSLRDDFEVSTAELDAMVACAQAQGGCYGARMTGAGFGGCAVALVEASAAEPVAASVATCYAAATGIEPAIYVCEAAAGAALVAGG
jgi:galactokinase